MAVRHLPYCVRGDFTCPTSSLPVADDVKSPRPGVFYNVCEGFHQVCGRRRRRRPSKDLLGDIRRHHQREESEDHAGRRVKGDGAKVILLRAEPASGDSPKANAHHAAAATSSLPVLGCRRSRQLVWSDSSLEYTLYADRGGSGQRSAARRRADDAPSFSMTRSAAAAATKDVHKVVQDKPWVECRPVTLSAKKPPPGTMVALPCPGTPRGRGEKFEECWEESPRAQRPRFHYTVRLPERVRHRRCLVPVGGAVWGEEEEEDAPRSSLHLLPRLAEPPRHRPSCARSVGGADQRGGVNYGKACRNSTYSEPAGIHAFTYIDRVLRWLRQVPADPLVYGADTEGPCSGATPRASRLDDSAVTANSQPHHLDMVSGTLDLPSLAPPTCLAASDPANGAPVLPRPAPPWDARASPLASGSISRPTTAKNAAAEGSLACGEGASSKGSFYPLNLMTSSSFERVSRHSGRLDMSPRPPNPSPCSTRSFAASSSSSSYSSHSPLSAASRVTSPGLDMGLRCEADETSFNTTERTHDRLSTNCFSSPDRRQGRQGGPPASTPPLTLGINVQPNVSVRYRRQPREILRPAQLRIVAKPSRKVARHVFKPSSRRAMKKRKKKKKKLAAHAQKDGAKTKKKRNPSGDPKKSTAAVKVIRKALRLLKRRKRGFQSGPRQGRCVLRALSPPRSPHSASSLTICETFQKVVGLTAQMRIDAIWTHTDDL